EATRDLADADAAIDGYFAGEVDLLAAGDELDGADEAGRIAGREELLGVGPDTAGTAQLARRGELHIQHAVGRHGFTVATAGGLRVSGVQNFLDRHGILRRFSVGG